MKNKGILIFSIIILGVSIIVLFFSCPLVNITTYILNYHANGATSGSVPIDNTSYKKNDVVIVKGNEGGLTRVGYVFTGWNTSSDGSGTLYQKGETFSIGESDVVLYARWVPIGQKTYQVQHYKEDIHGNYVLFETDTLSGVEGSTVVAQHKTYAEHFYNEDHEETILQGVILADGSLVLKLFYDRKTLCVTYYGNNNTAGVVPIDGKLYTYGETVIVLGNDGELIRTGYTFDSWNTAANGIGTTYDEDDEFPMPINNVNLYAIWVPNQYLVTLDADGGASPDNDELLVTFGSAYPSFDETHRDEAIFDGWYTERFGGGTRIYPGTTIVSIDENHTLYASWRDYIVGDKTSHGGYVFYIDDDDQFPWTYIETTPANLRIIEGDITVDTSVEGYYESAAGYIFGLYRTTENGENLYVNGLTTFNEETCTKTGIGTGMANTNSLIATMATHAYRYTNSNDDETTDEYAAKLCKDLNFNGYIDWFLPSKDELNTLRDNLNSSKYAIDGVIWSSSESEEGSMFGWSHFIVSDTPTIESRSDDLGIRPCRYQY